MKNILKRYVAKGLSKVQHGFHARPQRRYDKVLSFSEASRNFAQRNELHAYMHHYFHNLCPAEVVEHRKYFSQELRGFGEDAFHAMWHTIFSEYKPVDCLEIGVYRGQTISLWALLQKQMGIEGHIYGISPFTPAGDEVSVYLKNVDYRADTLENHRHFALAVPQLLKALSTDLVAHDLVKSRLWDLIYIDGNHDYDVALADYNVCKHQLRPGGLLVMDDSSLYTDYKPLAFSFAGHPGPSRVVMELAMHELCFIGGVGHNNVFRKAAS